jgi:Arc/MetJ-type ribon-helix-helix transcriptional regulator
MPCPGVLHSRSNPLIQQSARNVATTVIGMQFPRRSVMFRVFEEEPGSMKVELTPDAAHWVQVELAAGRFPTAEDAVRYAINRAKQAELRDMLDASEAEGGNNTSEEARRYVRDHLDHLNQTPKGG